MHLASFLSKGTFVHLSLGTELVHDNLSSKCDCRIMGNTLLSTAVCCLFTNPCSPFEISFHCALMQATWYSWLRYHVDKKCLVFFLGCCRSFKFCKPKQTNCLQYMQTHEWIHCSAHASSKRTVSISRNSDRELWTGSRYTSGHV